MPSANRLFAALSEVLWQSCCLMFVCERLWLEACTGVAHKHTSCCQLPLAQCSIKRACKLCTSLCHVAQHGASCRPWCRHLVTAMAPRRQRRQMMSMVVFMVSRLAKAAKASATVRTLLRHCCTLSQLCAAGAKHLEHVQLRICSTQSHTLSMCTCRLVGLSQLYRLHLLACTAPASLQFSRAGEPRRCARHTKNVTWIVCRWLHRAP